jgi:tetratricopeptide (TPR) repeat protein
VPKEVRILCGNGKKVSITCPRNWPSGNLTIDGHSKEEPRAGTAPHSPRPGADLPALRRRLALGISKEAISQYERGAKPLTRENLDSLVEPLAPPEAVDALLFAHQLIYPEPPKEAWSPLAPSAKERQTINRAAMAGARTAAERIRADLNRIWKQEKVDAAKQEAESLFRTLAPLPRKERNALVEVFPDYWDWALAVRVCEASVKKAAHRADEALELAELALSIAERVPGEESWRSRLKGYCWAHIAHARRIANDLSGADKGFAQAWELWRAGADCDPELLAEWLLLAMEASLRRSQRRFPEALELLDRAIASPGASSPENSSILLLEKEHVFNQMGDIESAFAALAKAEPLVAASGERRLLFALRFNMTDNLHRLEHFDKAAELLPQARDVAIEQANELDLIRVSWLSAKVSAGQGQTEEAISGLEQVVRDFTVRELAYDAALSSLDLSVLWLKEGRTAEVKKLAVAMCWIFKTQGIDREALAALSLFREAAQQESATVGLVRQVITDIEQARRSASPPVDGRGRG